MEEKILFVLKNVLGLESATKALSQQNCDKWDSLRHLNLIVELESEFGVEFDPEEISGMKCFEDIERVLTRVIRCGDRVHKYTLFRGIWLAKRYPYGS